MPNIQDTITKIESFAELADGWCFGEGGALSGEVIKFATRLVLDAQSKGISRANAFAGAEGELLVSFYIDNRSMELTLEADNSITFAEDCEDNQIDYIENLTVEEAYNKIWEFSQKSQSTLEPFTRNTSIQKAGSLRALLLSLRRTAASPSSIPSAQKPKARRFATTFRGTIETKQVSPKYTGTSQTKTSRQLVH